MPHSVAYGYVSLQHDDEEEEIAVLCDRLMTYAWSRSLPAEALSSTGSALVPPVTV
jgi:hypothetical protein